MEITDKIINKSNAVKELAKTLNVKGVIAKYPNEPFNGRLNYQIAKEAATLQFTDETLEILTQVGNISFTKDARTAAAYAYDLIMGWLVEDIIIEHIENSGLMVVKIGADAERRFLKSGAITSDLDIEIFNPNTGEKERFDIYFDANGYWAKYDKIDIRESKWNTLVKNNAAIICLSNQGVAIVDVNTDHTIAPNPLWGNKNSATIKGIKGLLNHAHGLTQALTERLGGK